MLRTQKTTIVQDEARNSTRTRKALVDCLRALHLLFYSGYIVLFLRALWRERDG